MRKTEYYALFNSQKEKSCIIFGFIVKKMRENLVVSQKVLPLHSLMKNSGVGSVAQLD